MFFVSGYPSRPFSISADEVAFSDTDWSTVDGARVIDGTPKSATKVLYTSADEKFCAGLYACTAGKWRVSYSEDEFCTLIEGSVTLSDENGASQTYSAPESFLIPSGFKGFWEPHGNLRKFFVIYEQGNDNS